MLEEVDDPENEEAELDQGQKCWSIVGHWLHHRHKQDVSNQKSNCKKLIPILLQDVYALLEDQLTDVIDESTLLAMDLGIQPNL